MSSDKSFENFQKYMQEVDAYKNEFLSETDTRCKFIDYLFINCLDWDESNIRREEHVTDGGKNLYIDYVFSTHHPILVVEAKKKDIIFNFPNDNKRIYKINGALSKTNCYDAIKQAHQYASSKSIKYAIVTNGTQMIAFIAVRTDGVEWDKGSCYVYRDLNDIMKNYVDFFNIFSKANFLSHSLDSKIIKMHKLAKHKRLIDALPHPDQTLFRNHYSDAMNRIIDNYFSDIIELVDKDVLDKCYCKNTELSIYENNLEALLKDNIPGEFPEVKKIILKGEKRKEEIEEDVKSYSKGAKTKIPVILIGGLGAGKTTFLRWFFEFKLDPKTKNSIFPIFIDFLKGPTDEKEYRNYIDEIIFEKLENNEDFKLSEWNILKAMYRSEIKLLEKGELSPLASQDYDRFELEVSNRIHTWKKNKFKHIGRMMRYLEESKKIRVIINFDNADQKDFEFQKKIYEYANMYTTNFECLAIISLREESFWQASRVGVFNAYHNHVYHIRAPRFSKLLKVRLDYALERVRLEKKQVITSFGAFKLNIVDLQSFLELIINSVLEHKKGVDILRFLECIACKNMRYALNMFKIFLTSGHTKIDFYIKEYMHTQKKYIVPFHEFARTVMLKDFCYFDEGRSDIILDVFALGDSGQDSHFTRLRILELLSNNINTSSSVGKGYIAIKEIELIFNKLNCTHDIIKEHLLVLIKYNLLETDNNMKETLEFSRFVKITAAGEYYISHLISNFAYLDVIATDIPIDNEVVYDDLKNKYIKESKTNQRSLTFRLEAVETILNYLAEIEEKELETYKTIKGLPFSLSFTDIIKDEFNQKKEYILSRLKK